MDSRFNFGKNPRFKSAPSDVKKVKVDSRFQKMFDDEAFQDGTSAVQKGKRATD